MSEENFDLLDEQEVDVSEDATPDMSYDKKGEPGKAVAATDAAEEPGKSAPARKGDKKKSALSQTLLLRQTSLKT